MAARAAGDGAATCKQDLHVPRWVSRVPADPPVASPTRPLRAHPCRCACAPPAPAQLARGGSPSPEPELRPAGYDPTWKNPGRSTELAPKHPHPPSRAGRRWAHGPALVSAHAGRSTPHGGAPIARQVHQGRRPVRDPPPLDFTFRVGWRTAVVPGINPGRRPRRARRRPPWWGQRAESSPGSAPPSLRVVASRRPAASVRGHNAATDAYPPMPHTGKIQGLTFGREELPPTPLSWSRREGWWNPQPTGWRV